MFQVYCFALTTDLNCVEDKMYDEDYDAAKIIELQRKIAPRFLFLGRALRNYEGVTRECALTAFSLDSSADNYKHILIIARQLYAYLNIDVEGYAPNWHSNDDIDMMRLGSMGNRIPKTPKYDETQAPSIILDSLYSLSKSVCNDISILLGTAKLKYLSWADTWPELNYNCCELLNFNKKLTIVSNKTASANEKLKFLHINFDAIIEQKLNKRGKSLATRKKSKKTVKKYRKK